jgi:hypothetical protein
MVSIIGEEEEEGEVVGFSSCTLNLGMLHTEENPPKK